MPLKVEELPCVCISLARRPDRWNRFIQQPEVRSGLPGVRNFAAVDGKTIDLRADSRISAFTKKNILNKTRRSHYELDSIGGVGCALSHIGVWKEFLDSGEPYMLVFEDDAVVYPGFVRRVNEALEPLGDNFDLIVLTRAYKAATSAFGHPTGFGQPSAFGRPTDFEKASAFVLAHCYIISRKAAQIFYDEALPITGHIDLYMSAQCEIKGLRLMCCRAIAAPQAGATSDIVTKPVCHICDVPANFNESMDLTYRWDMRVARTCEAVLAVGLVAYLVHRYWYQSV